MDPNDDQNGQKPMGTPAAGTDTGMPNDDTSTPASTPADVTQEPEIAPPPPAEEPSQGPVADEPAAGGESAADDTQAA